MAGEWSWTLVDYHPKQRTTPWNGVAGSDEGIAVWASLLEEAHGIQARIMLGRRGLPRFEAARPQREVGSPEINRRTRRAEAMGIGSSGSGTVGIAESACQRGQTTWARTCRAEGAGTAKGTRCGALLGGSDGRAGR